MHVLVGFRVRIRLGFEVVWSHDRNSCVQNFLVCLQWMINGFDRQACFTCIQPVVHLSRQVHLIKLAYHHLC